MSRPTATGTPGVLPLTRRAAGGAAMLASLALAACSGLTDPARPPGSGALSLEQSSPEFCYSLLEVAGNGTYCGVGTRIIPFAPADAYWGGATFQSDPGHGQSHDITIMFDSAVAAVEVTAYDPTFDGNELYAYDAHGALVGSGVFPGNYTPGQLTTQSVTVRGSISEVKLIAAQGDYLNYSMRVQYKGGPIELLEAKGLNEGSFLGRTAGFTGATAGEDMITLKAKIQDPTRESQVAWKVVDWDGDEVDTPLPASVPNGISSRFRVPAPGRSRWNAPHPYDLSRTSLAFEIHATLGNDSSEKKVVRQDAMDTQRQEYIDLAVPQLRIPTRASLGTSPYYTHGDYPTAVINAAFDRHLAQLEENWKPNQFTVNGLYRNPGHNAYHVNAGSSSGTVSASWHQYGCGADLQVYPAHPSTRAQIAAAEAFWRGLAAEAQAVGFEVEQLYQDPAHPRRPYSGIGHVHVELDCP